MARCRFVWIACTALWACGEDSPKSESSSLPSKVNPSMTDKAAPTKQEPKPPLDTGKLGKVLAEAGPLPLKEMLGQPPPVVQEKLGEPTGKGMQRKSCVRYTPERIWFGCNYAFQRYEDKTGTYKAVQVGYEDGKATSVGFEHIPGEGAFDPIVALRKIGLELPGDPTVKEPADNTKLWSWFNSTSRLLIDGKQYRVEVSTVDNKWEHSKVEVILNHPLDEAQKKKIKTSPG